MDADRVASVLRRYGLSAAAATPAGSGLINETFVVEAADGGRFILQRLNPVFPAVIHEDIEAVTVHLASRGMITPRLVRADDGALCVAEGTETWRLMTWIDGEARPRVRRAQEAASAGALLARFHGALRDLEHRFHNPRPGVHDAPAHFSRLRESLDRRRDHPRHGAVADLGRRILAFAESLAPPPRLPERIVHGDPKIDNVLFAPGTDRALCLIDLDTVGNMPLAFDLGDALRSWCNAAGEDAREAEFSPALFKAAVDAYGKEAAPWILPQEAAAVLPATSTICVELAARFCRDALEEDYFAWDPSQFPSHSEHSEVRAAGQLSLARSLLEARPRLEEILARAFPAP